MSLPSTPAQPLVLGGGCFWCLDAAFQLLPGVTGVTCGYAGGAVDRPTYEQVYTDATGHAEVVEITYDPARLPLERLLAFFWQVHNPTQADGQGEDLGTRYRSVIFYADEAQRAAAETSRAAEQSTLSAPIAATRSRCAGQLSSVAAWARTFTTGSPGGGGGAVAHAPSNQGTATNTRRSRMLWMLHPAAPISARASLWSPAAASQVDRSRRARAPGVRAEREEAR